MTKEAQAQLATQLSVEMVLARPFTKQADPAPTTAPAPAPTPTPANPGTAIDWAGYAKPVGIGAGIGGLGAYLASSLLAKRKQKDALTDAVWGALAGGLGGAAYKAIPDALNSKPTVPLTADDGKRYLRMYRKLDGTTYKKLVNLDGSALPGQTGPPIEKTDVMIGDTQTFPGEGANITQPDTILPVSKEVGKGALTGLGAGAVGAGVTGVYAAHSNKMRLLQGQLGELAAIPGMTASVKGRPEVAAVPARAAVPAGIDPVTGLVTPAVPGAAAVRYRAATPDTFSPAQRAIRSAIQTASGANASITDRGFVRGALGNEGVAEDVLSRVNPRNWFRSPGMAAHGMAPVSASIEGLAAAHGLPPEAIPELHAIFGKARAFKPNNILPAGKMSLGVGGVAAGLGILGGVLGGFNKYRDINREWDAGNAAAAQRWANQGQQP